ncbi:ABC transporter ATP-binding protein [Aestuariispira insulae]|uniref:Dipeptide transport system ATP-binding protein n=1 Tax=Aestuariispira insulae TaxID=1461337 RepID=A0A3D9HNS7_9PROT|nr:ABC transporter ATP-binding protein [Aestuariispira insulae]RED50951.1 dipeptide transport system ATP-binding protein [Aestuariispira insulae]
MSLLDIKNLSVEFQTAHGMFRAVDGVNFNVDKGQILSIVGESGSGKSVSMLALMGLLPWTAKVTADVMTFDGIDLLSISKKERRKIIGKDISMIFQEPMTSLNPCFTVGYQIMEVMKEHLGGTKKELEKRAVELLGMVGIPAPESRLKAYPHQMSGGMNQRVMIAMMIACKPRLLIADEPTTALDVTIQAQILELLVELQKKQDMALVLITHDMGVVAETAERVVVQYAGQQVEKQEVKGLFNHPGHPYTHALLNALPERATDKHLPSIPGVVPGQLDRPKGCLFSPRCEFATDLCHATPPTTTNGVLCHYPLQDGVPTGHPGGQQSKVAGGNG